MGWGLGCRYAGPVSNYFQGKAISFLISEQLTGAGQIALLLEGIWSCWFTRKYKDLKGSTELDPDYCIYTFGCSL